MTVNRLLLLSVAACAAILSSSGFASAQEQSPFEGARICYSYTPDETAPAKRFSNNFTFILNEDNSMDFGFSHWFPSGSNCALSGNAYETEDGWHYSAKTDIPHEKCEIDITMDDTEITLNAENDAPCRAQCGAGAIIHSIRYPLSYITSKNIWPADVLTHNVIEAGCE